VQLSESDSEASAGVGGSFAKMLSSKAGSKATAAPKKAAVSAGSTRGTSTSSTTASSQGKGNGTCKKAKQHTASSQGKHAKDTASSQTTPTQKDLLKQKRGATVVDGRAARVLASLQSAATGIDSRIREILFDEAYEPVKSDDTAAAAADQKAKSRNKLICKLKGDCKEALSRIANSANKASLQEVSRSIEEAHAKVEEAANFLRINGGKNVLPEEYMESKTCLEQFGFTLGSAYAVKVLQLQCQHALTFQEYDKLVDMFMEASPEAARKHIEGNGCQHQEPLCQSMHVVCQSASVSS
jgi:hypothetical protein